MLFPYSVVFFFVFFFQNRLFDNFFFFFTEYTHRVNDVSTISANRNAVPSTTDATGVQRKPSVDNNVPMIPSTDPASDTCSRRRRVAAASTVHQQIRDDAGISTHAQVAHASALRPRTTRTKNKKKQAKTTAQRKQNQPPESLLLPESHHTHNGTGTVAACSFRPLPLMSRWVGRERESWLAHPVPMRLWVRMGVVQQRSA